MTFVDLPASTADLPKEKQLLMEEIMHCRYIEPDGKCWDNLPTLSTALWMSEPSTALSFCWLGSHAIRAMWFRIRTASSGRSERSSQRIDGRCDHTVDAPVEYGESPIFARN